MIPYSDSLVKVYSSYFGVYVDIKDVVISKMFSYITDHSEELEAGGVLIGYKVKDSNSIVIEDVTEPDTQDERSRFYFVRKSVQHLNTVIKKKKLKSFCIGNWHTHPFSMNPNPSSVDNNTWNKELIECKSGHGFQIFIICGREGFRVWIGKENDLVIQECQECAMIDGLYVEEK